MKKRNCYSCNLSDIIEVINNQKKAENIYNRILESSLAPPPLTSIKSAEKPFKKIWFSKPKTSEELSEKRSNNLRKNLSNQGRNLKKPISCGLATLKVLAKMSKKHDIFLTIPETIIIGYGFESPVLLYTNEKGILKLHENLSNHQFQTFLEILEKYRSDPSHHYIGPLAIKREPNSMYNKVMMKQTEIILEWKEAYKIDLVIQRYVLSKGMKTSKIRISYANEIKIYKITNKIRQDFKEDKVLMAQTAPIVDRNAKSPKKNIFTEIAEDNKSLIGKALQQFHKRKSVMRISDSLSKNEASVLKNKDKTVDFSRDFSRIDSIRPVRKFRKSVFLPKSVHNDLNPMPAKRSVSSMLDYFQSCVKAPSTKTLEELFKDLSHSKHEETRFPLEDMMYTVFFRDKVNKIFSVCSQNLEKSEVYDIKGFKGLESAIRMMKELSRIINGYFLSSYGLRVTKIICDFVEDVHQKVYLLKLRTYEYDKLQNHQSLKGFNTQFVCSGKYCNLKPSSEVKPVFFSIFKKIIIDDEKVHGDPKSQECLSLSRAYEKVKVCKNCYDFYTNAKTGPKRNYSTSGIIIKKIKAAEAALILNEINPRNAAETVKIVPSTVKTMPLSTFLQSSQSLVRKKKRISTEDNKNARKSFFELKKNEILNASHENDFFNFEI